MVVEEVAVINPAELFDEHRSFLWGLSYRLTGNAADADDIVQDTFLRVLTRPPADLGRSLRPWLVQVALNLGRDLLRRRRRCEYIGPWLPSPIEAEPPSHEPVDESGNPATRYDMIESVSFAFLLALEALSPMQRAVLLLRDVFDYSAREAAEALGISEANARTHHTRARRALEAYEATRHPPTVERKTRTQAALDRFLRFVASGDTAGAESMLAADARLMSDGGGQFFAARIPVIGAAKIARMLIRIAKASQPTLYSAERTLNGLPALAIERAPNEGYASQFVLQAEADEAGKLTRIYLVLAARKLSAIRWTKSSPTHGAARPAPTASPA
jgi:RNA polymerase sigma-70 factor (ECF subfamily)